MGSGGQGKPPHWCCQLPTPSGGLQVPGLTVFEGPADCRLLQRRLEAQPVGFLQGSLGSQKIPQVLEDLGRRKKVRLADSPEPEVLRRLSPGPGGHL